MNSNQNKAIGFGIISFIIFEGLNYLRDRNHFQHEYAWLLSLALFIGLGFFIIRLDEKKKKKSHKQQ